MRRSSPPSSRQWVTAPRRAGQVGLLGAGVLGAALLGCSPSYVYLPGEQLTAVVEGQPAARYPLPPEAPTGDVRVHSYGVVELEVKGEDDEIAALHVALWLSNDAGSQPWTLDTRAVRVELRRAEGRPELLKAGTERLPVVEIPPGQQRIVEMMFPLPEGIDEASDLPAFDVVWQVQTDTRLVGERTPFERIRVQTRPAGPAWSYTYGYGHGWWYDPFWRPGSGIGVGRAPMMMERDMVLQPRIHMRPMAPRPR
ncbi:hypothetical protein [Chondromyces crocatus]|uniref:Uncharacterized protein n=1 Tax=Chondromyces crocatus TaxID=52 RepID=A0A0K1EPP8_CHOCO|nr:hypothetical protein [Chondromyces crocatus]AKT42578.1 uncharacterized protein CMC5_068050 [Chondromyces crocatus]